MSGNTGGYQCTVCSFELWHPIARLSVSFLGLYNDARFPGRCLLVLEKHAEDFSEIDPKLAQAFIGDAQIAARSIRSATEVPRINYAILGNQEPHLHIHLVPRGYPDDPIPTRPPWEHPAKKAELPIEEVNRLVREIRLALESATTRAGRVGVR